MHGVSVRTWELLYNKISLLTASGCRVRLVSGWYTFFYKSNFIRTTRLKFLIICPRIKNKLRTIEGRLQIQMLQLKVFY